jgi:hypothetical protein
MLHEPAQTAHGVDEAAAYKRRLGLKMLAAYSLLYVIFIIINVGWPKTMGTILVGGLNLAIVYERQNRIDAAVRILEEAMRVDPSYAKGQRALERLKTMGTR